MKFLRSMQVKDHTLVLYAYVTLTHAAKAGALLSPFSCWACSELETPTAALYSTLDQELVLLYVVSP